MMRHAQTDRPATYTQHTFYAASNEASAVATNGQIEVDDDSSASVEVEPGSEDKPRPTEEDDVGAGADANVRRGAK